MYRKARHMGLACLPRAVYGPGSGKCGTADSRSAKGSNPAGAVDHSGRSRLLLSPMSDLAHSADGLRRSANVAIGRRLATE